MVEKGPVLFAKEALGFEPYSYQEEFLTDSSKRIAVDAQRVSGKTTVAAVRAIYFALSKADSDVVIVSATQRLSMRMFDTILKLLGHDLFSDTVMFHSRTRIKFYNRSQIWVCPCGRDGFALRGLNAHLVIVDDAALVSDEVLTVAVPPMIATTNGTIILISSPSDNFNYYFKALYSPKWSFHKFTRVSNPSGVQDFSEV